MTNQTRSVDVRGSVLLLVIMLIAVLSLAGVAMVALSSQERVNAAGKGKRDAMAACAQAARLAMWAEFAKYGRNYAESGALVPEIVLPDGTRLAGAHYGADPTTTTVLDSLSMRDVNFIGDATTTDLTNTIGTARDQNHSRSFAAIARCTDPSGRQLEVEFTFAFAL